ncbi:MAG: hypothetical protein M1378_09355 [Bacteroidetes bacterium]|nr:hypothetical protein [Bacteroidota bacterium]
MLSIFSEEPINMIAKALLDGLVSSFEEIENFSKPQSKETMSPPAFARNLVRDPGVRMPWEFLKRGLKTECETPLGTYEKGSAVDSERDIVK